MYIIYVILRDLQFLWVAINDLMWCCVATVLWKKKLWQICLKFGPWAAVENYSMGDSRAGNRLLAGPLPFFCSLGYISKRIPTLQKKTPYNVDWISPPCFRTDAFLVERIGRPLQVALGCWVGKFPNSFSPLNPNNVRASNLHSYRPTSPYFLCWSGPAGSQPWGSEQARPAKSEGETERPSQVAVCC